MNLFSELKRRNVLRAGVLYAGATWALAQGLAQLLPLFGDYNWIARWFVIAACIGFPFALAFAWFYEFTPQGLKRESEIAADASIPRSTGRMLDKWIIGVLTIAVVLLLTNAFVWHKGAGPGGASKTVAISAKSIAVLPFEDLSAGHDHGYFSAGMAEELLNALVKVQGLKVAGRASSFYYGRQNADLRTIGRSLDVANVLEGSVRTQGNAVRISVQLIRTSDGFEVWSQSYDGDLANIFALQERIAGAITGHLQIVLTGSEKARLVPVATTSAEAYADFITAQALVNQRVGDSLPRAIALLQRATVLDPNFTRAWAKLAIAYAVLPQYASAQWKESWRLSDDAAHRALALDADDAEAYAALSYNRFSQRRYVAMVEPMQRALQLAPGNSAVNFWAANELSSMGRSRAAEARIDVALADDPANPLLLFYKSIMRWRAGDEAGARATLHRDSTRDSAYADMMRAYLDAGDGDVKQAIVEYGRSVSAHGSKIPQSEQLSIFRGVYGTPAQRQAALAIVAGYEHDDWAPSALLLLGEPARSFGLFETGKSGLSDAYLNYLWTPQPKPRKARQSPAFQGFAKRIGMLAYWKQYGWPDLCKPAPDKGLDAFACQ